MKKLLIAVMSVSLLFGGIVGCGHTPIASMTQVNRAIVTSVNVGMDVWADYVKAGFATTEQIQEVKKAYNSYYSSQQILKGAVITLASKQNLTDADIAALSANTDATEKARIALINLLNTYLK